MLKNDITINGILINSLHFSSKERVIRTCDRCGEDGETSWNTIARCRKRHNTTKDYCFKCSCKIYNTGENNSSKNPEVKQKISKAKSGKSAHFKDGKNPRILDRKTTVNGYILKWLPEENKHVHEHRLILAEKLNKHHSEMDQVHHINGIKHDNNISNLIEFNHSEHSILHSQLEKLAFELVNKNLIILSFGIGVGIIDGRRSNAGGGGCHSGHQPLSLC